MLTFYRQPMVRFLALLTAFLLTVLSVLQCMAHAMFRDVAWTAVPWLVLLFIVYVCERDLWRERRDKRASKRPGDNHQGNGPQSSN